MPLFNIIIKLIEILIKFGIKIAILRHEKNNLKKKLLCTTD